MLVVKHDEDGGSMFIRNGGIYLHGHKALQRRRQNVQNTHISKQSVMKISGSHGGEYE
jgi:hypothetical protein